MESIDHIKAKLSSMLEESTLIIKLAIPMVAAFLAQKGMQLIDTLMMGWIGPNALAAGALGTSIFMAIVFFCRGTLNSVGVFIARSLGANDFDDIKSSLFHGYYLVFFLSLPCMLLVWFSPEILILLKQNPAVVINVKLLLHGLVWGIPGFLLFFVFREILAAFSQYRIVMWVSLASIALTFFGNYVLIYGKLGLPKLGIAGIGYAGSVVMWLMFVSLWMYCRKHPQLKKYLDTKLLPFNWHKMWDMFYIGAPIGLMVVLDTGMFLIAAIMMGYFSVAALAAYQITMQCASIAFNIPVAVSVVVSMRVSHALGAKKQLNAKRSVYCGMAIGILISLIIAAIFILFPGILARPFVKTGENNYLEILHYAESFLAIVALFQGLDAIQIIANGALRGYKDTWVPMTLSIGCYLLLGVGSAYYFAFRTSLGAIGIWYGITVGICTVGIILGWRLFYRLQSASIR